MRSRFSSPTAALAAGLAVCALGTTAHAQITRDDFNGGFRSDLGWSFQSPGSGGNGVVGNRNDALVGFSNGRLNLDSQAFGSLFGDNSNPTNLPNLTVVSVPTNWYVETSVLMNLADLTDRSRFTQAELFIYRDADFYFSDEYVNQANSATPTVGVSTNAQSALGNSTYGGFFGTNITPNNTQEVRMRVERKTDGNASGFVLGGNNPGLYLGYNLGAGWVTFGTVVNNSGDSNQQVTFNVLSQMAPGYRLGLGASSAPPTGPSPVAKFDYIETNLGIAAAAPEPGSLALVFPLVVGLITRRRRK